MIAVANLCLQQGRFVLQGISLKIPTGSYGVLMGKTGCGKTSLLEAIAGLRPIKAGCIVLDDRDVTPLPPAARGVGYVPQDLALFRTMTVRQHLDFALTIRGVDADRADRRVRELAGWLGISHLLDRRPAGLSGGEAQRVALGRALSFWPRTLLLDEPLSSLDEETRDQLVELLRGIRQQGGVTVLHVTHSRREAEALGDVIFRLEAGQIHLERKPVPCSGAIKSEDLQ
jgi:ABC-type sugar transport system ATPase subunit